MVVVRSQAEVNPPVTGQQIGKRVGWMGLIGSYRLSAGWHGGPIKCGRPTSPTSPWPRVYLVAIMDWYSRYVVAWRLSNTLDAAFCVEVLDEALRKGKPEVFNTDQGGQFTSEGFIGLLKQHGVSISMDGKGRYSDNIFIERLWRTVKYEEVYLKAYSGGREAKAGHAYFSFYNNQRPHQALGYRTPAEVFNGGLAPSDERPINGKWTPSRVADLRRRDSHLTLPQTCPTDGVHGFRGRRW